MTQSMEKSYQAVLCLEKLGGGPEYIPLGPPRKLIADIVIDLARNLKEVEMRYKDSTNHTIVGAGAIVLWPRDSAWTRFIPEECLTDFEQV